MTEDEAKTKWCPAYQVSTAGAGGSQYSSTSFNKADNRPKDDGNCLGSGCMAWRWEAGTFDEYGKPSVKNAQGYIVKAGGYCGLAGRPE